MRGTGIIIRGGHQRRASEAGIRGGHQRRAFSASSGQGAMHAQQGALPRYGQGRGRGGLSERDAIQRLCPCSEWEGCHQNGIIRAGPTLRLGPPGCVVAVSSEQGHQRSSEQGHQRSSEEAERAGLPAERAVVPRSCGRDTPVQSTVGCPPFLSSAPLPFLLHSNAHSSHTIIHTSPRGVSTPSSAPLPAADRRQPASRAGKCGEGVETTGEQGRGAGEEGEEKPTRRSGKWSG